MKLLKLDADHSDQNIVEAVQYFLDKDGLPDEDAPIRCLTDGEIAAINRDGNFRPKLYSMVLAGKVAEGIANKTLFLQHSYKYAWDSENN